MKKLNKSHKTDYVFLEVLSEIDEIKENKISKRIKIYILILFYIKKNFY